MVVLVTDKVAPSAVRAPEAETTYLGGRPMDKRTLAAGVVSGAALLALPATGTAHNTAGSCSGFVFTNYPRADIVDLRQSIDGGPEAAGTFSVPPGSYEKTLTAPLLAPIPADRQPHTIVLQANRGRGYDPELRFVFAGICQGGPPPAPPPSTPPPMSPPADIATPVVQPTP